jgi:glycosyltransferase involved in cell wall biosynthesis
MSSAAISVLIPSYNRRRLLERVLRAYESQDLEGVPFEVVVVDDGSKDDTLAFLASWNPRRYRLRFATQPNGGPARARNHAIRVSTGRLVLFTGDDILPSPALLKEHWRAHQALPDRDTVILGLSRWPLDMKLTSTMRHIDGVGAQQFSYHYFKEGAEYDFRHFYTSNISLKRELLEQEPTYFSTHFSKAAFEDVELSYRLSLHGMRIVYHSAPQGYHYHHYDVRSFFRRQVGSGAMAAIFYRKYPELRKWFETKELEWTRLRALIQTPAERNESALIASDLSLWEDRVLRLAGYYDDLEAGPVDHLLLPLFRYAYLKGLADAMYPPPEAMTLCANLYCNLIPPAVRTFEAEMNERRLPIPRADLEAIRRHAR